MATSLNKYSFRCIHRLTPFCIKTNLRENRFFAAKWTIVGKKGTHNVKISTENLTKIIILHARASGQRHRKDVRLQQPARAVVGECCSQPAKTTSWKSRSNLLSTSRFQLVENVWNILPPSRLLKHNHVLPQTNGAVFQVFIVSLSRNFVHERGVIWLLTFPKNTERQRKKPSSASCRHWKKTNTYAHLANGGTCRAM